MGNEASGHETSTQDTTQPDQDTSLVFIPDSDVIDKLKPFNFEACV